MTKTHAKPGKPGRTGPALIVFGLSEIGKPRAGTFLEGEIETATKAAEGMGLVVLKVSDDQAHDLATKLPAGRVHANGRGFLPFIRGNLYEQLQDLAKAQSTKTNDSGLDGDPNSELPTKTAHGQSPTEQRLPKNWEDIDVGHLVVAQDTDPKEGWWPAIVVQNNGDMFTVRWQQPQSRSRVVKHKYNLALMWPGDDVHLKASEPKAPDSIYPASWQAIGLQALVLAKEEGPMEQWWEATPIEVDADIFKLRWRDYPALPPIVRARLALALLHPKPVGVKAESSAAA